jgi:hypothetical protein
MRVRGTCHPAGPGKSLAGIAMNDENITVNITDLKAQIDGAAYQVDVDAVAEAFVSRMRAVHGALRRADVRALLGQATYDEIQV